MFEVRRIKVSFSHTRLLRIFSIICKYAYEHHGTIIPNVDCPQIVDEIKNRFGGRYRKPSIIIDYLKTAEAMGLLSSYLGRRFFLTDYGLLIACGVLEDDLNNLYLSSFEKMFYLQTLIRKDLDYLYVISTILPKFQFLIKGALQVLFMSRSRLGSLEKIREEFKEKLKQRIDSLYKSAEGRKLLTKVDEWKERTLNHRISSRIFWLVELMFEDHFVPKAIDKYTDEIIQKVERLHESLDKIEFSINYDELVDNIFPEIYLYTFGIKTKADIDNNLIKNEIKKNISEYWEKMSSLEIKNFGNRISALPFLLLLQMKFLSLGIALSMDTIIKFFRKEMTNEGYILVWRRDFHSGYIEKIF